MPRPPHSCACGAYVLPDGKLCQCQDKAQRERRARHDARRPSPQMRGYNRDWREARKHYLSRHPHCAMCSRPATLIDHIIPHRGDKALFWNVANWQPLCTHCHSSVKQRLERTNRR